MQGSQDTLNKKAKQQTDWEKASMPDIANSDQICRQIVEGFRTIDPIQHDVADSFVKIRVGKSELGAKSLKAGNVNERKSGSSRFRVGEIRQVM
jgi:hypothetical protein